MIDRDFVKLARTMAREAFVAAHGCCFLVARQDLRTPLRAQSTATYQVVAPGLLPGSVPDWRPIGEEGDEAKWIVLAVIKRQPTFPSMITVGRTANNDVVIQDESVSKFHAHFKQRASGLELMDASSRNGTFIGGKALPSRGPAVSVQPDDVLRFGQVELVLLDAPSCWARLRG